MYPFKSIKGNEGVRDFDEMEEEDEDEEGEGEEEEEDKREEEEVGREAIFVGEGKILSLERNGLNVLETLEVTFSGVIGKELM